MEEVKRLGVISLNIGLNHKTIIHVIIFMNAILAIIDTLFIVVKVEESNRKLGLRSSQLSVQLQEATSMHNAKVIMMMVMVVMIVIMIMMMVMVMIILKVIMMMMAVMVIMPVQRWLCYM